jgi:transcriptional regulator with XRE-family HTH domain
VGNINNFEDQIGGRIKALRLSKGLDQRTLAGRSGLRRSYISLIENGKKTAAVSTLALIADALGVGVGELFENSENFRSPKIAVTRNIEAQPSGKKTSFGYTYKPLCSEKRNRITDPFVVRLEPKSKQRYGFVHRGEEFLYVLRGLLKLSYDGEIIILEEGDAAYFESSVPHKLEVNGTETAYVISVNTTGGKSLSGREARSTERSGEISRKQEEDL